MQQHNTWGWVLVLNYIAFFFCLVGVVYSFPELPFIAALTFFTLAVFIIFFHTDSKH